MADVGFTGDEKQFRFAIEAVAVYSMKKGDGLYPQVWTPEAGIEINGTLTAVRLSI